MSKDYLKKDDKILIGNILDKYNKFEKTGISTYSNFLNTEKLEMVTKYLEHKKIKYDIYPKYDFLEKKIIVFGDYLDYVSFYKIEISDKITHSNILGTLFSLGIDNDMIGDIFVENGYFYYTNLTKMNSLLENNFLIIKNEPIKLKRVNEIVLEKNHFQEFDILTSSMRIDNILSKIINKSRSYINRMILEKQILLNYEEIKNNSINLNTGDILSIRKYGKYRIGHKKGNTKKDNIILGIIKYI